MNQLPAIVIHGGAWAIPDPFVERSVAGVKTAAKVGYEVLLQDGSAVDAVEAAVKSLENDPIFNAGKYLIRSWFLGPILPPQSCGTWQNPFSLSFCSYSFVDSFNCSRHRFIPKQQRRGGDGCYDHGW